MKLNSIKLDLVAILLTFLITRVVYKFTGFSYSLSQGVFNPDFMMDAGICLLLFNLVLYILEKIYRKNK